MMIVLATTNLLKTEPAMPVTFLVTLFRVGFFCSVAYLTVANLARLGVSGHCQVSVSPSIQSGFSPSAVLQVVTQTTHLSKDCYPQLVLNPHHSDIQPPKQLDYKCKALHDAWCYDNVDVRTDIDLCSFDF